MAWPVIIQGKKEDGCGMLYFCFCAFIASRILLGNISWGDIGIVQDIFTNMQATGSPVVLSLSASTATAVARPDLKNPSYTLRILKSHLLVKHCILTFFLFSGTFKCIALQNKLIYNCPAKSFLKKHSPESQDFPKACTSFRSIFPASCMDLLLRRWLWHQVLS